MSSNEEGYKEWQDRYESLEDEYDEGWDDETKRDHLENMRIANEQELEGRLEARDEWGDEGNDGHDQRIRNVQDQDLLLNNAIAYHEGTYEYQTESMQDMDAELRRELEEENNRRWAPKENEGEEQEEQEEDDSDMDVCDSDSD